MSADLSSADDLCGATHADGCWSWGRKHYDCALRQLEALTRERDQYKLAAEMAQTSIIELQKERDALAERLSVAEELFASECEDPVNNLDAYLWYHGERHKKLAEDAGT